MLSEVDRLNVAKASLGEQAFKVNATAPVAQRGKCCDEIESGYSSSWADDRTGKTTVQKRLITLLNGATYRAPALEFGV